MEYRVRLIGHRAPKVEGELMQVLDIIVDGLTYPEVAERVMRHMRSMYVSEMHIVVVPPERK